MSDTPSPYHHGDLPEALLTAALAALDREGALPSLRALAAACGVSRAAPYRHFADTEALQTAIAARCFAHLSATIRAAWQDTPSPQDALRAGCMAYLRYGLNHPARYALMFQHTRSDEAVAAFGTLTEATQRCGASAPTRTAFVIWTMLHGTVDLLRQGLRPPDDERGPDSLIADVLEGVVQQVR